MGISLRCSGPQSEHTPSFSNLRNGVNSDAITPQSELCPVSSPVAISHAIDHTNDNSVTDAVEASHRSHHNINTNFLTSPPISTRSKMSKYSQLSTRAVTYSPNAKSTVLPRLQHYAYTTNNVLYHHNNQSISKQLIRHYSNTNDNKKRVTKPIDSEEEDDDDDVIFIAKGGVQSAQSPHYMYPIDSNSENDMIPITPFNREEYSQSLKQLEMSRHTAHTLTNPTFIVHPDYDNDEIIDIDPNGDDSPLLEMYVIYPLFVLYLVYKYQSTHQYNINGRIYFGRCKFFGSILIAKSCAILNF